MTFEKIKKEIGTLKSEANATAEQVALLRKKVSDLEIAKEQALENGTEKQYIEAAAALEYWKAKVARANTDNLTPEIIEKAVALTKEVKAERKRIVSEQMAKIPGIIDELKSIEKMYDKSNSQIEELLSDITSIGAGIRPEIVNIYGETYLWEFKISYQGLHNCVNGLEKLKP